MDGKIGKLLLGRRANLFFNFHFWRMMVDTSTKIGALRADVPPFRHSWDAAVRVPAARGAAWHLNQPQSGTWLGRNGTGAAKMQPGHRNRQARAATKWYSGGRCLG